jgi:hypothetical protein
VRLGTHLEVDILRQGAIGDLCTPCYRTETVAVQIDRMPPRGVGQFADSSVLRCLTNRP